ncbi:sigma-Y antisigma factor component [Cytobacillus sp. IB215665]|uniref:sigma-Y antisigma factor component n=1 Tax=Cytobacillus sp. IB215665 TaxID=3097357 RepID=UPI002A1867AF|nr:sigma-Y antisigma factor component [Cytobacillus sp. IB215665]MDX8366993.1 sigma-Y antisigma factor component [Cytobacillus sp. IB215665]
MTSEELVVIPIVAIILITQSTLLFFDARKHGYNYWLWGIIGLIQAPMPSLFYVLFVRRGGYYFNRRNNKHKK